MTEVAAPFPMSLNAVSKHIQVLERAQLVVRRRQGREHLLSVNPRGLDAAAGWIDDQRRMWAGMLERLDAVLLAEDEETTR